MSGPLDTGFIILDTDDEHYGFVKRDYIYPAVSGSATFLELTDTPASFAGHGEEFVRVNAGETALEFAAGGGGAAAFLDLTDTPASYSGQQYKVPIVNTAESGLEFVTFTGLEIGLYVTESETTGATHTPPGYGKNNEYFVTALATNITAINAPSGTPTNGNRLVMRIKASAATRTIAGWNAIYRQMGHNFPYYLPQDKTVYISFLYNGTDSKWDLIGVNRED